MARIGRAVTLTTSTICDPIELSCTEVLYSRVIGICGNVALYNKMNASSIVF